MIFDRSLVVLVARTCVLLAPITLPAAPSSALGQPAAPLLSQQPLPGAPAWTVTDVLDAPVARGDVVAAVVSATSATTGTRQGVVVWTSAGGIATRVVPGASIGGRSIESIPAASLRVDDLGRVLFVARDALGDRLLRASSSTVETLLSGGDAAPGAPAGQLISLMAGQPSLESSLRVNGSAIALITRLTGANPPIDRALIQLTPTRVYIRDGEVIGSDGVEQLNSCTLASNGMPVASSALASSLSSQALWLGSAPALAAITGQSLALPGGIGSLVAIEAWSSSAAGIAIRARVDASGNLVRGVWTRSGTAAAFVRRVSEGDTIPALGTVAGVSDPAYASDGSVTMAIRLAGPSVTAGNDVALVRIGAGGINAGVTLLAREGTALTDGSGALPALESLMLIAPRIALAGDQVGWLGDLSGQTALFTASAAQNARALRTGQTIPTALGNASVTALSWPAGITGGDDGRPAGMSGTTLASRAILSTPSGTRSALVVSVLGPPRCGRADVAGANQSVGPSGTLTADDIIVFLSWYFAGDLRADFAGANQTPTPNGSLSADDIIVFLSAFFAGC